MQSFSTTVSVKGLNNSSLYIYTKSKQNEVNCVPCKKAEGHIDNESYQLN